MSELRCIAQQRASFWHYATRLGFSVRLSSLKQGALTIYLID